MSTPAQEFLRQAAVKSADMKHRRTVRRGIDHYEAALERTAVRFNDWQAARQRAHEIKWDAINHLDRYLLQFEEKIVARGGHVFWAETSEEAQQYILDVAAKNKVRTVVKSKSMATEEIHLTGALEKQGVKVFETDLGEFIVQLRNERPYHIMTPAMHLNRTDIAELFREKLGHQGTDDPNQLVDTARAALREAFFAADMGVSGVNFMVADTGMMALTTNEGNGRLGTSLPRIHVAVCGIEKILPKAEDLALFWPLLARSASGQPVACYNTLIAGAKFPGEVDGPEEFHIVLLDNGRSELLADTEERDVLHCIRCGACLNACPVFRTIGGHTYNTTYPGPIGSVLTPNLMGGEQFQHLSYASSLCGSCTDICPVKIDLHHHLLHNRRNTVDSSARPRSERMGFALWRWAMMSAGRLTFFGGLGRAALRVVYALGLKRTAVDPLKPWTEIHEAPPIPKKSFRALWKEQQSHHG